MTTTDFDFDSYNTRHASDFGSVWCALESQVLRVLDEEGNNVADCRVRHLLGNYWLCVDDMDGYYILHQDFVKDLFVVPENA